MGIALRKQFSVNVIIFSTGKWVKKAMLKASDAIVLDENFGPKEKEKKENMPALLKENSSRSQGFTISLGPGPLWWS